MCTHGQVVMSREVLKQRSAQSLGCKRCSDPTAFQQQCHFIADTDLGDAQYQFPAPG